jgi:hypothetical protein
MARQTLITQKRRGPKPTGVGVLIGVRLHPEQIAAIDQWIAEQFTAYTRPEAIRALVDLGLAYREPVQLKSPSRRKPTR